MTKAILYTDKNNTVIEFELIGHAGYADSGNDIVCAAISTLVINTINSIDCLTDAVFTNSSDEDKAKISFELIDTDNKDAILLINSMVIGLEDIASNYGKYLKLSYRRYTK